MRLLLVAAIVGAALAAEQPVHGTKCTKNQVIHRLTVYEDGALEAECGPIPCGESGLRCIDDQTSCRADTDIFSGMKWAANGQSVLLRCCTLNVNNKIYVGTDLVGLGSYYVGGAVAEKDLYGSGGPEHDFIANIRTEQGGVRVWVYRIMCGESEDRSESVVSERQEDVVREGPQTQAAPSGDNHQFAFEKRRQYLLKHLGEQQKQEQLEDADDEVLEEETIEEQKDAAAQTVAVDAPPNPLQYRPQNRRVSSGVMRS